MTRSVKSIRTPAADSCVGPFRVSYAVGAASRAEEYRLRYSVFVKEHQWLSANPLAGEMEIDEFDEWCGSFLLKDAATGDVAACQRLILPDRLPPGRLTNVERECRSAAGADLFDLEALPRRVWAEVSRTTIAPQYRWGSSATSLPAMIAIKYASIALAAALGRTTLLSLSEPRTARLVRRLGFPLHQIGPTIDFHGERAPFRIDLVEVFQSVPLPRRRMLDQLIGEARRAVERVDRSRPGCSDRAA